MRYVLWPLGVVVAFGLGLAMTGLSRDARSAAQAADHPQAVVRRLQEQVGTVAGSGGPARWQRTREVAADVRAMGDAGTRAHAAIARR
jgi:hypothetical protein